MFAYYYISRRCAIYTEKSSKIWGLILIILGLIFLLNQFDIHIFSLLWPLAIVGFGVYLIYRATRKSSGENTSSYDFSMFADGRQEIITGPVDGTKISRFIGDVNLDVRNGILKPGANAIELSSFIGDMRIVVKTGTAVRLRASNMVGDVRFFDSHRSAFGSSLTVSTPDYDTAASKVDIVSSSFIGDIWVSAV